LRRAMLGIDRVDCNCMLINVILVRVMQMAIMKIIDMVIMPDRRMPTVRTMRVAVVDMMLLGAGSHSLFPFFILGSRETGGFGSQETGGFRRSAACSIALSTKRRT
jgi:hypothetical protein